MSPADLFERILASLHGAVLNDERWPAASRMLDEATGAKGNFLVTGEGAVTDEVDVFFARCCYRGERNVELERAYLDIYHPIDEGMPRIRQLPDGEVVHVTSLYTEEEKKTSLVYNEALPRFDAVDSLFVRLEGPSGTRIVWAIGDPVGDTGWSSGQLDIIRQLLPHLRQYVRVRQALVDAGALGTTFSALLENARTGVIEFDRRGRVKAVNDRAGNFLRSEYGLKYQAGRLKSSDPLENAELGRLLGSALPGRGGIASSGSMTLHTPGAYSRTILHICPVPTPSVQARGAGIGAIGLLLNVPRRTRIQPARLASILGLTAAESDLAVALARGQTIREIAVDTRRSETTLRWHLKHIFAKHGLARQIDLVQLVNALDFLGGHPD